MEQALSDFDNGYISNQTLDIAFMVAGAEVPGTAVHLDRKERSAEMERQVARLRALAAGSKESGREGEGADPRLKSAYKEKIKGAMAEVVGAQQKLQQIQDRLALHQERRAGAEEYKNKHGLDDQGRANYDSFLARNTNDAPWNKLLPQAQAELAEKMALLEEANRQTAEAHAPLTAAQEAKYDDALKDSFLSLEEKALVKQKALLAAAADLPRDFSELWGSQDFWKGKTPFVGDAVSLYQMLPAATIAGKLEAGDEVSPQELALLHEAMAELSRPSTPGARALDWTASGGSLALELASTAGTYTALKKGALTHAAKGFQNLLTKAGRKTVEKLMEKMTVKQAANPANVRLYTYRSTRRFKGHVFKPGEDQGRLWVTHHGPEGGWWQKPGLQYNLLRALRTGRWEPFKGVKEITGPAAQQFTKVRAIGPFRGWKRAGGQYYTTQPGSLNLKTGKFLPPEPGHIKMRLQDAAASHGLDIGTLGAGALLYNVLTDDDEDLKLPPMKFPDSKKDH